ncbi:hypothetical protein DXG03_001383 [Asterophora parasitica]|uniref:Glycoside hydrolase 131 catalytic N-terminal domain-containing protein n=1 Tax=Asterophora parasitica TaxID=117018 RepID=A0A9P7G3H8_9AGAR|nr:hypothetical protein DXG03_001383 [Asterophora parasitica]
MAFRILASAVLLLALQVVGAYAQTCNTYVVPSITGGFTQRQFIDFSKVSPGGNVASLLSANGISISNYPISAGPVPRTFTPNNVAFGSGSLDMKVSAYRGSGSVLSSEILTNDLFKYASVRTVLKSSGVPGVCEGNFFYLNDNQEIDWEILTSTTLTGNDGVPAGIWASNQALVPGQPSTHQNIPFTFDPSQGYHGEGNLDLPLRVLNLANSGLQNIESTADATVFYIDGVQKARFTTNVRLLSIYTLLPHSGIDAQKKTDTDAGGALDLEFME